MSNIIELEDLYYNYKDGTEALRGLSLYVRQGEKVALLGPNGAGKSTLLLHLNGIHLPQRGRVAVMGQELGPKNRKWVRTQVGLVFQDPDDQVFSTTVGEDVAFGPRNMDLGSQEVESRVANALEAVGMSLYRDKAPHHLSYGQKKRVAIAGVLAMNPGVIVLDEPMSYLDPAGKESLLQILDRLQQRGATIIMATHDVDVAAEWAHRLIILKGGKTLAQGDTSLLGDEELVREARLSLPTVAKIFLQVPLNISPLPLTVKDAVAALQKINHVLL